MNYDDKHRKFLQYLMQAGVVLDSEAAAVAMQIFAERISLKSIRSQINDRLNPLGMDIKGGVCEISGEKYWMVVGTTLEPSVKFPPMFKDPQNTYLKAIFTEIISSEDGSVSSTDCLNLVDNLPEIKLLKRDADIFLKEMYKMGYLCYREGFVFMGVKSIVELQPYFKATYQDNFYTCLLCKDILFHGQKCNNCEKIIHYHCMTKYVSLRKVQNCPNCNEPMKAFDVPAEALNASTHSSQEDDEPMEVTEGSIEEAPEEAPEQVAEDTAEEAQEEASDSSPEIRMKRRSKRSRRI
ncbi:hypothetical protein TKK_0004483 [Trichogramma kaykai]|uniref:Non-structural maintenance of chromosomes element 1 homolog n=1 Tax=Trichogramma kaykai TaxID=54128 RepID=A0ABD2XNF1_9HYME